MLEKFRAWIERQLPWITLISIILALVSLGYAYQQRAVGEIGYLKNSVKVFDAVNKSEKLRITDAQGEPILSDIVVLNVIFANTGDFAATKSRIRRPLSIVLTNVDTLIDVKVVDQTDPQTMSVETTISDGTESQKVVAINWKNFDPGQRFEVLIFYGSNPLSRSSVSGSIYGFSILDANKANFGPAIYWKWLGIVFAIPMAALCMMGGLAIFYEALQNIKNGSAKSPRKLIAFLFHLAFALMVFSFGIAFVYASYNLITKPAIILSN